MPKHEQDSRATKSSYVRVYDDLVVFRQLILKNDKALV